MRCCGCLIIYALLAGLWFASSVVIGTEFAGGAGIGFAVALVIGIVGRR